MHQRTNTVQNEFWFHVANQEEIPIFGVVDKDLDIPLLMQILQGFPAKKQDFYISQIIEKNPDTIDFLRTFVGISDKRMYLELSYLFAKTKYLPTDSTNILGKTLYELDKHPLSFFKNLIVGKDQNLAKKSVEIITKYLIDRQLLDILKLFKKLQQSEIETIVEKLILPKEIQQAEAKRRGHGAEHNVANLLQQLGVSFVPSNKHLNPMTSNDPNVDIDTFEIIQKQKSKTYSFDLIVETHLHKPFAFLQGLIHTSDPGQYGVNKSDETVQIKRDLIKSNQKYNTQKQHWGLVDGVGFSENKRDTIDKMLSEFDCFVQLKTLYKVGLQLHKLGLVQLKAIRFDMNFYTIDEAQAMFDKYGSADIQCVTDKTIPQGREIEAGKAWVYV
ncbi:MAG: hypothetical protein EAZ20_07360 [Bacteroidetes bacterium]|nr:MAG: hypothetical protein EAZ20_07360 [Bacteroidota bacterium]